MPAAATRVASITPIWKETVLLELHTHEHRVPVSSDSAVVASINHSLSSNQSCIEGNYSAENCTRASCKVLRAAILQTSQQPLG
eukprot:6457600-Amphidinium_carterae.1